MASIIRYTDQHEWILVEGDVAIVGITEYAQKQLGDVVFVELPDEGKSFAMGDQAAVVESVKAAAEVYAPITGDIVEINEDLANKPELVNEDATGDGWFFKMSIDDESELDSLMDAKEYGEFVKGLD
jgi:glycine cleavage system H protein